MSAGDPAAEQTGVEQQQLGRVDVDAAGERKRNFPIAQTTAAAYQFDSEWSFFQRGDDINSRYEVRRDAACRKIRPSTVPLRRNHEIDPRKNGRTDNLLDNSRRQAIVDLADEAAVQALARASCDLAQQAVGDASLELQ